MQMIATQFANLGAALGPSADASATITLFGLTFLVYTAGFYASFESMNCASGLCSCQEGARCCCLITILCTWQVRSLLCVHVWRGCNGCGVFNPGRCLPGPGL